MMEYENKQTLYRDLVPYLPQTSSLNPEFENGRGVFRNPDYIVVLSFTLQASGLLTPFLRIFSEDTADYKIDHSSQLKSEDLVDIRDDLIRIMEAWKSWPKDMYFRTKTTGQCQLIVWDSSSKDEEYFIPLGESLGSFRTMYTNGKSWCLYFEGFSLSFIDRDTYPIVVMKDPPKRSHRSKADIECILRIYRNLYDTLSLYERITGILPPKEDF